MGRATSYSAYSVPSLIDEDLAIDDRVAGATDGIQHSVVQSGSGQLFVLQAGDTCQITGSDVHQGALGDCFLLASMAELAFVRPGTISNMIHPNQDGTETVTLYTTVSNVFGTVVAARPNTQTVSNVFNPSGVNGGSSSGEIWAQIIEKSFAQGNGGYAGISNGGDPENALEQLTGHDATDYLPTAKTLSMLTKFPYDGSLVVMSTKASPSLPNNLTSEHAYMFKGFETIGGASYIKLGNPWGFNDPTPVPTSQAAQVFSMVTIGRA